MKPNSKNSLLIGFYQYSLDPKNRLAIPAKFREILIRKSFILSQGLEGCLTLQSDASWHNMNSKLESLPLKNKKDSRGFKRMLYASAAIVQLDGDGRILIPQNLVDYARMQKEVCLVGLGNQIEIWALEQWKKYENSQKNSFVHHASKLEL